MGVFEFVLLAVGSSLVALIVALWVLSSAMESLRTEVHGRIDKRFDALAERIKDTRADTRSDVLSLGQRIDALDKRTLDDINAIAEHVGLDWDEPHNGRWVSKATSDTETTK